MSIYFRQGSSASYREMVNDVYGTIEISGCNGNDIKVCAKTIQDYEQINNVINKLFTEYLEKTKTNGFFKYPMRIYNYLNGSTVRHEKLISYTLHEEIITKVRRIFLWLGYFEPNRLFKLAKHQLKKGHTIEEADEYMISVLGIPWGLLEG